MKILLERERYVYKEFVQSIKLNYMKYSRTEGKSSEKAVILWVEIVEKSYIIRLA